jgi:hypothetical protein
MKKVIIGIMLIISAFILVGCSGKSKSIYIVNPTPLKKESSKYYVKDLKVNLTEQGFLPENILGINKENKSFLDEQHLREEFAQFLNNRLREKGILGDQNDFALSIVIDYHRVFHMGGNALMKPIVSHRYKVYDKDSTLLAQDGLNQYTTKYAYFEEVAVSVELLAMQWDAEDEPKDVKMISELLIDDISRLGW